MSPSTPARRSITLALLALPPLASLANKNNQNSTIISICPFAPPRTIITAFQPWRLYFEKQLGLPFQILTAQDYPTFHKRTLAGDYHLVLTPPHLARLAEIDAGHFPVATLEPGLEALLVGTAERSQPLVQGLRNQRIAFVNRYTFAVTQILYLLGERGLREGRDFETVQVRSDDSVPAMLRRGEAAAAIINGTEVDLTGRSGTNDLRVLERIGSSFGPVLMRDPRAEMFDSAAVATLAEGLTAPFNGDESPVARAGFRNLRMLRPGELASLDYLMVETRRSLLKAPF